jgi:hypothetical protein
VPKNIFYRLSARRPGSRLLWDRTFGHTADPTFGDFALVFLFVLLAVSALAPPARNHSAFVSFLFVGDLLVADRLLFFADLFVFIGYFLVRAQYGKQNRASSSSHPGAERPTDADIQSCDFG